MCKTDQDHVWQPIPDGKGRFRCTKCKVMGYQRSQLHFQRYRKIIAYVCSMKGCQALAVERHRHNGFCQVHKIGGD